MARIERIAGQAAWRCKAKNSFAVLRRKLRYFASRGALNIEGLGPSTVDALLEKGLVEHADDFFTFTEGDLLTLEGLQRSPQKNLLSLSKKYPRACRSRGFVTGALYPAVGEETAILLAQNFKTIDDIAQASEEKARAINGIGPIVAKAIYDWFSEKENKRLCCALKKHHKKEPEKIQVRTAAAWPAKRLCLQEGLELMSAMRLKKKYASWAARVLSSI
jgi:DNA ligase (NAD+)